MTVNGAAGDWDGAWNMVDGIHIWGTVLPSGWTDPVADIVPLTGTFSITNSIFNYMEEGAFANFLLNSNIAMRNNIVTDSWYGLSIGDISNTNVLLSGNQGTITYGTAIEVEQLVLKSDLLSSTAIITDNNFQLSQGANGVFVADLGQYNFGITSTPLSAVVSGNVFQNSHPAGNNPFASVIVSLELESTIVSSNTIAGGGSPGVYITDGPGTVISNAITGADTGVWLDSASGVLVVGNVIKNSVEYSIAVTSTNAFGLPITPSPSSNNFIVGNFVHNSGIYDLYWDGVGTGNVWYGNYYSTSNF